MGLIHISNIKSKLDDLFKDLTKMSDCKASGGDFDSVYLTRSLASYALHFIAEAPPTAAASAITDGGDDNGIDALYYDTGTKRLFIVQSKWKHDGSGSPDSADTKKFVDGVRDLFNQKKDRFNSKFTPHWPVIEQALKDPATVYELILVHTGSADLAVHSQRNLDDLLEEMNDTTEVLFVTVMNQGSLYSSLAASVAGAPVDLEIGLKSWGKIEEPHVAYYGQVGGGQIAGWWAANRTRLFAKNIRNVLGDTDVNGEMRETLARDPDSFWYFNNGITIIAKSVKKPMAGGADRDFSTFHCKDVSIVNGAQTVGSLGKFGSEDPGKLDGVYVPVRIIVHGTDQIFGEAVTRTNNRQNRIEARDFVTLDPEQNRIRTELAILGIEYQVTRAETFLRTEKAFDFVEGITALVCASGRIRLVVQLKREIGKLYEDITKSPYKELFNPSVTGWWVWRVVQIQRRIDKALEDFVRTSSVKSNIPIHGNRIISQLVFGALPKSKMGKVELGLEDFASAERIEELVTDKATKVQDTLTTNYPNSIVPTLFKNLKKCENIVASVETLDLI